jgi:hypothetical protein
MHTHLGLPFTFPGIFTVLIIFSICAEAQEILFRQTVIDNNVSGHREVADMDLDGRPDVILAHSEKPGYPVSWYRAPEDPGNQPWTEHVIGRVDKCHNLKVADFDLDGDPDVLVGTLPNFPHEAPHHFGIYINHGIHWNGTGRS